MVKRIVCVRCRKAFKSGVACKKCGSYMMPLEVNHSAFFALMLLFAVMSIGAIVLTVLSVYPIMFLLIFPLIAVAAVFDFADEYMINKNAVKMTHSLPQMPPSTMQQR